MAIVNVLSSEIETGLRNEIISFSKMLTDQFANRIDLRNVQTSQTLQTSQKSLPDSNIESIRTKYVQEATTYFKQYHPRFTAARLAKTNIEKIVNDTMRSIQSCNMM